MRKTLAALVIAVTSVMAAWGAASTPWSDTRVPSPEQQRVLDAVNARRRTAGARPLEWDPVAASVVLQAFRDSRHPDDKFIDSGLEKGHGFDASWGWSSRAAANGSAAGEG